MEIFKKIFVQNLEKNFVHNVEGWKISTMFCFYLPFCFCLFKFLLLFLKNICFYLNLYLFFFSLNCLAKNIFFIPFVQLRPVHLAFLYYFMGGWERGYATGWSGLCITRKKIKEQCTFYIYLNFIWCIPYILGQRLMGLWKILLFFNFVFRVWVWGE